MARRISEIDRRQLFDDIQYLNLEEMREFCRSHDLPRYIMVEGANGRLRRSRDRDRKDIVLKRIFDFAVDEKRVDATVYGRQVVAESPLPKGLSGRTRLKYGQYEKKNAEFLAVMDRLTDGQYRNGMISRLVLRDFWTDGVAPTLAQFARAWIKATHEHRDPRPEGAYLVDLARGEAGPEWKALRIRRARRALTALRKLVASHTKNSR